MCICAAEFYKWLRAFKVVTGGGNANLSYGEMVITDNARPTQGTYPAVDWVKVEAGNPLAPATPPDYSLYGPGDLHNWEFDSVNARLVYIGLKSGYYSVRASLSACVDSGSVLQVSFRLRKNDDEAGTFALKSTMNSLVPFGLAPGNIIEETASISLQASDFFETGDFIDLIVQNNAGAALPIVNYMDFFASSLGDKAAPLEEIFVITNTGDNVIIDTGDDVIVNQ